MCQVGLQEQRRFLTAPIFGSGLWYNISMPISKFELQDFRCFKERQELLFAIPNPSMEGSGLTYIVGENNSGKTTLLEAMHFSDRRGLESSTLRSSDAKSPDTHFTFYNENSSIIQDLRRRRDRSYSLVNCSNGEPGALDDLVFIPSRRYWSPRVLNRYNINNARANIGNYPSSLRRLMDQGDSSQIADIFYSIEEDDLSYSSYISTMKQIFPDFESFTVRSEDYVYIAYETTDGHEHRADFLGDGIASIMRIVAHLVLYQNDNRNEILIIDEPELSLHPVAKKRLIRLLGKRSMTQQIVLATHEPYFIVWDYIKNGARVNCIRKNNETHESTIFTLGNFSRYCGIVNAGNWQQPFLADVVSREIFFCDNILFVEGQEDVGLLVGKVDSKINLFGYGVRGFSNFKYALNLAHDIGLSKVGAIIDNGRAETSTYRELKAAFPDYCIVQWDRNDIRDKTGGFLMTESGEPDFNNIVSV